jgi:hypothetical protein
MAKPPYHLNLGKFESLCKAHGFKNQTEFVEASGIPRRTFQAVLAGDQADIKMTTVAYFLDTFDNIPMEFLFTRTKSEELALEKQAA